MKNSIGFWIRQNRLKQNLSQEGLCKGICVVSYLSKIEQGLVRPSPEIVEQLFRALGIRYRQDEAFLKRGRRMLEGYFDAFFFQEDGEQAVSQLLSEGKELEESELHLEYHLFLLFWAISKTDSAAALEQAAYLEPFLDYMEPVQQFRFYLGKGMALEDHRKSLVVLHKAEHLDSCPMLAFAICSRYFAAGEYAKAIHYGEQAYRQASEEGNLFILIESSLLIATSHSNQNELSSMLIYYKRALNLSRKTRFPIQGIVYYNIGASYVANRQYQTGIPYLQRAGETVTTPEERLLCLHKLCIAYGETGEKQKAEKALQEAQALLREYPSPPHARLLRLAGLRLEDGFLDHPEYAALLQEIYSSIEKDLAYGFKQFHAPFLIELYTHQRKYKEALAVSQEIQLNFPVIDDLSLLID